MAGHVTTHVTRSGEFEAINDFPAKEISFKEPHLCLTSTLQWH